MAGPLPAPDPTPLSTSTPLLLDSNLLPLSSSNQIKEHPSPLLLRPSDPAVRWSDQAGPSSDLRPPLPQPPFSAPPPPDLLFLLPFVSDPPPFPPASLGPAPDLTSTTSDPPVSAPFSSFAASQDPPALQRPESSIPAHPSTGFAHDGTPYVRSYDPAAAISSAAPCSAAAAPPPLLQPSPDGHPSTDAAPAMPVGAPTAPLLARPATVSLPAHPADLQQRPPSVRRNAQATSLASAQAHPSLSRSSPSPPLRSYAQVASGTRGSGFVSSHARDIEAFARLPRTGINIISGSREGLHSFGIIPSDFPKIAKVYANALVMKFLGGRPSLEQSHKEISSWGIVNPFSIGPLSSRAFLLRFQDENDLLKVLTRPSSTIITSSYKIFRWQSECHIKEDSCMAPVWISLPNLPLHCFLPEFLEAIANKIGRFLCLDKATATLARPSAARMCVEIDLRKQPPQFIWINLFGGFKQPVGYDKLPKFCNQCHIRGHSTVHCSKYTLDNPQSLLAGRPSVMRNSTQTVRRNANMQSAVISQGNTPLDPPASISQPGASLIIPLDPTPSSTVGLVPVSDQLPVEVEQHHSPIPNDLLPAAAQQLLAAHPSGQFTVDEVSHPPLPPPPSKATANSSSSFPAAAASSSASDQPPSSGPHPLSEVQSVGSQIPEPAHTVVPPPAQSLSAQAAPFSPSDHVPQMQQTPKSSSVKPLFPAIKLMPSPRSSTIRAKAAVVSATAPPPLHQPTLIQNPPPPPARSRSKQHKSVSFMPQQSNLQANQTLWDVVNRQIDQFNKACLSTNEMDPVYTHTYEEPADLSSFSHFESDSGASVEANSPMGSHSAMAQEEGNSFPQSYASEGEEPNVEPITLQGHISDNAFYQRPKSSKRNKRHPDGPLKVKLRARKGSSSIHR